MVETQIDSQPETGAARRAGTATRGVPPPPRPLVEAKGFSFFGLTPADFLKVLQMNGVDVDPGATSRLDNKVSTFTIKSTGEAGSIKKTLTAVVRMGAPGTLGQLLYWREE